MPGGIDSSTVVNDRLEGGDSSIQIDRLASEGSAQSLSPRLRRALATSAIDHKRNLQESGIPSDVLDALLPGDDIIELQEPHVAGGVLYRFGKRLFDVVSCGAALIALSPVMLYCALRIKRERVPVPYFIHRVVLEKMGGYLRFISFVVCIRTQRRAVLSGLRTTIPV